MPSYAAGDVVPLHPVTGKPATYFWENPKTGAREPRWGKGSRVPEKGLQAAPENTWLSTSDISRMTGKTVETVRRRWIDSGRGPLKASRGPSPSGRGTGWLVWAPDFIAFMRGRPGLVPRTERFPDRKAG